MDNDLLAADFSSLPESDQARISSAIDQMQTRDRRCSLPAILALSELYKHRNIVPIKASVTPVLHLDREEQDQTVLCKIDAALCNTLHINMQGMTSEFFELGNANSH